MGLCVQVLAQTGVEDGARNNAETRGVAVHRRDAGPNVGRVICAQPLREFADSSDAAVDSGAVVLACDHTVDRGRVL